MHGPKVPSMRNPSYTLQHGGLGSTGGAAREEGTCRVDVSSAFGLWRDAGGVVRFDVASLKGLDRGLHSCSREDEPLSSRVQWSLDRSSDPVTPLNQCLSFHLISPLSLSLSLLSCWCNDHAFLQSTNDHTVMNILINRRAAIAVVILAWRALNSGHTVTTRIPDSALVVHFCASTVCPPPENRSGCEEDGNRCVPAARTFILSLCNTSSVPSHSV